MSQIVGAPAPDSEFRGLYKLGGVAALVGDCQRLIDKDANFIMARN